MRNISRALWLIPVGLLLATVPRCFCGSCFVAGTLVETPDGPRAIETLVAGDAVISVRVSDGARFTRRVDAVTTGVGYEFHTLTVDGVTTHQMTGTHPVFDARQRAFVPAADLPADAQLLNAQGEATAVTGHAVETRWLIPRRVFNLSVDGPDHTFIADGVVVHNKDFISIGGQLLDPALCECARERFSTVDCSSSPQGSSDGGALGACCQYSAETRPEQFQCANRGVRNPSGIGSLGARVLDLSGNQIADVSTLGEYPATPRIINLANNPIEDIRDFSLSFGWCGSAPTIDLRGTLLDQGDLPDVDRLRDGGCVVETSLP